MILRVRNTANGMAFDDDCTERLFRPYRAYYYSIISIPGPSARANMFRALSFYSLSGRYPVCHTVSFLPLSAHTDIIFQLTSTGGCKWIPR